MMAARNSQATEPQEREVRAPIVLVLVRDSAEHASVLVRLPNLLAERRALVAPVLATDEHLDVLVRTLSRHGHLVRSLSYDEFQTNAASSIADAGGAFAFRERPQLVLVSEGVDELTRDLAGALAGAPVQLIDASREIDLAPGVRSALVLVHPDVTDPQPVYRALDRLARCAIPFGVIPTAEPRVARFALLKTLLIEVARPHRHALSLLSGIYPLDKTAPPAAHGFTGPRHIERSAEGRIPAEALFRHDCNVLVLNGHSNAIDQGLGGLVLCARAGDGSEGGRFFPCVRDDGACVQQAFLRRDPMSRTGLVSLKDSNATAVLVVGCNSLSIGRSVFDPARTTLVHAIEGAALAVIGTTALVTSRIELDVVAIALMSEGMPLGEVVRAMNRINIEAYGATSWSEDVASPYVLIGDPNLRVPGVRVQRPKVVWEAGAATVQMADVVFDAQHGAFLRVDIPESVPASSVTLGGDLEGVFCVGAAYADGAGARAYLWIATEQSVGGRSLVVRFAEVEPWDAAQKALARYGAEQPFWLSTLPILREVLQMRGAPLDGVDLALGEVSDLYRFQAAASTALASMRGVARRIDETDLVWQQATDGWNHFDERLFSVLTQMVSSFGPGSLDVWMSSFVLDGAIRTAERCACGRAEVTGQRFANQALGSRRAVYQCPICGPLGQDDGRRILRPLTLPSGGARGETLEFRARALVPAGELVKILSCAFLRCWKGERTMRSEFCRVRLGPSRTKDIALLVKIPSDLTPGVYQAGILSLVNGALSVSSCRVEVY